MKSIFKAVAGLFSKNPKPAQVIEPTPIVEPVSTPDRRIECIRNLTNVQGFTDRFMESAMTVEKETGIPALVMIAQVALETGWGGHILKLYPQGSQELTISNNLFNIKASRSWNGQTGTRNVWEDTDKDGQRDPDEYFVESFRMYPDFAASFRDYTRLITENSRYAACVAAKDDPDKFAYELEEAGYATDGQYAEKLQVMMRKNWRYVTV